MLSYIGDYVVSRHCIGDEVSGVSHVSYENVLQLCRNVFLGNDCELGSYYGIESAGVCVAGNVFGPIVKSSSYSVVSELSIDELLGIGVSYVCGHKDSVLRGLVYSLCNDLYLCSRDDYARVYSSLDDVVIFGTGNDIKLSCCGDGARIGISGKCAEISCGGSRSHIISLGDSSRINVGGSFARVYCAGAGSVVLSSGYGSMINVVGHDGTVMCSGRCSRVKGVVGTVINLYCTVGDKLILCSGEVGKDGIEPDVWYEASPDGKLVVAKDSLPFSLV